MLILFFSDRHHVLPHDQDLCCRKLNPMSVVKVIEVLSDSRVSWEHAAQQAVAIASKTLSNVKICPYKGL